MSIYADPKRIYDLLNSQTTRIREQDAEIERLKAEVERLQKVADEINEKYLYLINDRPEGLAG